MAVVRTVPIVRGRRVKTLRTPEELRAFALDGLYGYATDVLLEANEIEQRKNPPNTATAIRLDRRTRPLTERQAAAINRLPVNNTRIEGWRRRISLFYGQQVDIFQAVSAVYNDLVRLTRADTGRGAGSIYFWCEDKDNPPGVRLSSLGQVRAWLIGVEGTRVTVHILGPTVVYRRKLVYNPRGRPFQQKVNVNSRRLRGTALDRIVNQVSGNTIEANRRTSPSGRITDYVNVQVAVHRIVVRRNKRKFPGAWMSYGFTPSREPLPPDRNTGKSYGQGPGFGNIPVIYVGGSRRRVRGRR